MTRGCVPAIISASKPVTLPPSFSTQSHRIMPELSHLPTEIFQHITASFSTDCLASCALVSKTWNAIFTPLLYRNIKLIWQRPRHICHVNTGFRNHMRPCPCELEGRCDRDDPDKQCFQAYSSCLSPIPDATIRLPSLYSLTKTVLSSSTLARTVESLILVGPVPSSIWTDPEHTGLAHDDHLCIRKLACQRRLSQGQGFEFWLERLDRGLPGAYAALLLLCLDSLRYVEIGSDFHDPLQFISRDITSLVPRLETACLGVGHCEKTVYMGGGRAPYDVGDVSSILSLFRLPAIQALTLSLPSPRDTLNWLGEVPLAGKLKTLELQFTYMGPNDLIRLLMACPTISDLKYDLWTTRPAHLQCDEQDPFDRTSEALLNISTMKRALLMIMDSLEVFHFHVSPPLLAWTNQCLGHLPFNNFQSLKTLHVPLQMLLGSCRTAKLGQSLPSSLVNLWLNDDAAPLWLRHTRYIDA